MVPATKTNMAITAHKHTFEYIFQKRSFLVGYLRSLEQNLVILWTPVKNIPFMVYTDIEFLMDSCLNDENLG